MKTNAIVRIILYSLLILALVGVLLSGIGFNLFLYLFDSDGDVVTSDSGIVPAADVQKLDIDWAAGSVTIIAGNTDAITFKEEGRFTQSQAMSYYVEDHTLNLEYSESNVYFGFRNNPEKDLIITVPKSWICESLEIDGAALEIKVEDLTSDAISLDGAAIEFFYTGTFNDLECDGAACEMNITCLTPPARISIDGAACELDLSLPKYCGFLVETQGLACAFKSNVPHTAQNSTYSYGDRQCQIDVDGMACEIAITVSDTLGPTSPTTPAN